MNNKASLEVNFDEAGNCYIRRQLDLPDWFIDDCRAKYEESKARQSFETEHAFALPDFLIFEWMAQGYDISKEDPQTTVRKLRNEGLGYLITSAKFD